MVNLRWKKITTESAGPSPRFTPNSFFDDARDRLVVSMGQGDGFFNDVWALDIESRTWSELGADTTNRPPERYGAGSAFDPVGDRLFVTHGFTNDGRFDDTWIFDLEKEIWKQVETEGAVPLRRCLTRGAWDGTNQRLLLFAGQSNPDPVRDDFWSLNVATGRWKEINRDPRPSARVLYGADFDVARGRWWVFGGGGDEGPVGSLWVYNVEKKQWARRGRGKPRPSAREGPDLAIASDELVMFGGNDGKNDSDETWLRAL